MTCFVSEQVRDNCWNLYDSFGEICVHCGCCSSDPEIRYGARVRCVSEWLREQEGFDRWDDDPEMKHLQMRNQRVTIERLKRQLRYYYKRWREIENGKGQVQAQH